MPSYQDLLDALQNSAKTGNQMQVNAQPSIMDDAKNPDGSDIDPEGTAKIAQAKLNVQGANLGAGSAMGTIGTPSSGALQKILGGAAEDAAPSLEGLTGNALPSDMSLADRIQLAKQRSNVQVVPTGQQSIDDAITAQFKDAPKNFFEDARNQAAQKGIGASPLEQQQMALQKQNIQDGLARRNLQQLQQAKDPQFQNLKKMFVK